jgi:hypothetical protein
LGKTTRNGEANALLDGLHKLDTDVGYQHYRAYWIKHMIL